MPKLKNQTKIKITEQEEKIQPTTNERKYKITKESSKQNAQE